MERRIGPSAQLAGVNMLITGAAAGLGQAIATIAAKRGAAVGLLDIDLEGLRETAAEIRAVGASVSVARCDVADPSSIDEALNHVAGELKSIDCVVNNAGTMDNSTLEKMSDTQWSRVLSTNLFGPFALMRASLPILQESDNASVVNISSLAGISGVFGGANYAASKGGLIALTKSAAREWARYGIRVNAIVPGPIETAILENLRPEVRQSKLEPVLLSRAADPDEVARVVAFFASDDASYITGQYMIVDGGRADKL